MKVRDLLDAKGTEVVTVRPDELVRAAAKRMKVNRVGALVVSVDGRHVDGILSERDIVVACAEQGERALDASVEEVMSKDVVTCAPDAALALVMHEMTTRRHRHLPVVVDRELVGLVSIGDVVKHRLEEADLETRVLRDVAISRQ